MAKKDAAEQETVEEQRQLAQRELEELYKRMDEQLEQTKARNRSVGWRVSASFGLLDPTSHCGLSLWQKNGKLCLAGQTRQRPE